MRLSHFIRHSNRMAVSASANLKSLIIQSVYSTHAKVKMRKNKQRNRHRVATLNQIPPFPNPTDNNLIYSEPISKISDWSSSIVIQSDLPSTKASYGWRQGSVARPYRNRFTSRADAAGRSNWTTAHYGTCRQPPE